MNMMPNKFRMVERLVRVPLALEPRRALGLIDSLHLAGLTQAGGKPQAGFFGGDEAAPAQPEQDPLYGVVGGVALISVKDVLFQYDEDCVVEFWDFTFRWGTGYDRIDQALETALADDAVKAIALIIDSPGGTCAGCYDLADAIFEARGTKPIWAVLSETACSAAYLLASACDKVSVPQSGMTGSIGVIAMFPDISKMLGDFGVTMNIIQFGARKADGWPELPMPDEARKAFQAEINLFGDLFVEAVARNRKLKALSVQRQEAGVFVGAGGVDAGLADMVLSPKAALQALVKTI